MEEGEEQKTSKYSSGVNILLRLNVLWIDANNHSRAGFFAKWNGDLDTIWRELARDLPDKEYNDQKSTKEDKEKVTEGYLTQFNDIDKKLNDFGNFQDDLQDSFDPPENDAIKKRNNHYKVLMEKELFLRRLENHVGKGTTWDEDDDDFD